MFDDFNKFDDPADTVKFSDYITSRADREQLYLDEVETDFDDIRKERQVNDRFTSRKSLQFDANSRHKQ